MEASILSFAVESIGKLLVEEASFLQGVSDEVRLLHEDMKRMEWFLKYAETKQNVRESVQPWVSEFRAIAYEANDTVEDYTFRIRKEGFTNSLKKCACIFRDCYIRHNLGMEIQSLRTRISNLTKHFGEYGITTIMEQEGSSSMQQQLKRTYSFVADQEDVIGLDTDVEILVKCLLNEGQVIYHKVVSIYGMGGLGKTTLARKVYHNPKLKQYFTDFAWICVSQQWQAKDILLGILVKLIPPQQRSELMNSTEEELAKRLHQILQDRTCLIVIDDIWSKYAWDSIKHAFSIAEEGSKILLTTRKKEVVLHIDPDGYHHQPPFLNEEESWELLQKKSLRKKSGEGGEDYHKMEELGKTMVKYCRGLPLAVVVLGGILKTKMNLSEWTIVHENVKSYLERGESIGQDEGEVSKILAYSYYDLPYQLKPCFLYLGKFKEDSGIDAVELYQLWMAEGMVLEKDRIGQESMMCVAEHYLEELASRSMVQVELQEEGWPAFPRFKSCRLHDLMRDLCLLKAKEENLFKVIDFGQVQQGLVDSNSLQREQIKHLRSLMLLDRIRLPDSSRGNFNLNNFKMLRVLTIECTSFGRHIANLKTEGIGCLIHLRYLSLRSSYSLKLPSSLGNLQHLETLDLHEAYVDRIPNVLWKMESLRHLYLPRLIDRNLNCSKLSLDGLSKLEILEGFDNRDCDSKSISKLINLRSFTATVAEKLEDLEIIIKSISNSNQLRVTQLSVAECYLNSEKGFALLEQMLFNMNLHILSIESGLCKQLPHYQSLPHNISPGLIQLTLQYCKIEEDPMGTLEKLPNLRKLRFWDGSFVGKEMICHAMGFPKLKLLMLDSLPNLEKWKVDEGAMPKLSKLEIENCRRLEKIPDGLRSVTTLKELRIIHMPQEFENRVQIVNGEEGPDFDKVRHVPSVVINLW
ncbi:hypothetical protein ACH5RR_032887 [Cinchona calisaya]|uniref:Disease resistance protein At1g50180 n=1 Tax=Cinchona calisaya TaxID=153742 RepID=A0ABD2YNJ7_9GENT